MSFVKWLDNDDAPSATDV